MSNKSEFSPKDYSISQPRIDTSSQPEAKKAQSSSSKAIFFKILGIGSGTAVSKGEPTTGLLGGVDYPSYKEIKAKIKEFRESKPTSKKALATDTVAKNAAFPSKTMGSFISNIPSNILNALRDVGGMFELHETIHEFKELLKEGKVEDAFQHLDNAHLTKDQKVYCFKQLEGKALLNAMERVCDPTNMGKYEFLKKNPILKEKCIAAGFPEVKKMLKDGKTNEVVKMLNLLRDVDNKKFTDKLINDPTLKEKCIDAGYKELNKMCSGGRAVETAEILCLLEKIDNKENVTKVLLEKYPDSMNDIIRGLCRYEANRPTSNPGTFFRESSLAETLPFTYMKLILDKEFGSWKSELGSAIGNGSGENLELDLTFYNKIYAYMPGGAHENEPMPKELQEVFERKLNDVISNLTSFTAEKLPQQVKDICNIMKQEINNPNLPSGDRVVMRNLYLKVLVPELGVQESKGLSGTRSIFAPVLQAAANNFPIGTKNPHFSFMNDKKEALEQQLREGLFR